MFGGADVMGRSCGEDVGGAHERPPRSQKFSKTGSKMKHSERIVSGCVLQY